MTAKDFFHALVNYTCGAKHVEYKEPTDWTKYITDQIISILSSSNSVVETKDSETSTSKEYYRIDVTSWIQQKEQIETECNSVEMIPHLWQLKTAVEHENKVKDWLDEVCKLAFIRCPLRIVIGYGIENADSKIEIVKKILLETKAFTDENQEFAIILGVSEKAFRENSFNPCGYQLWELKKNGENLTCEHETIIS